MSPWQFSDRRIIKLNFQAYNGLIFNAKHLISHDKRRSSLACGVIGCLRRHIGRDASLVVNLCFQWHGVVSEFSVRHCFVKSLCCLPHGNGACLVIHSSGNLSCRSTFYHHRISRCFFNAYGCFRRKPPLYADQSMGCCDRALFCSHRGLIHLSCTGRIDSSRSFLVVSYSVKPIMLWKYCFKNCQKYLTHWI